MKYSIQIFFLTFLTAQVSLANPNQNLQTWPEDPVAITTSNASNYRLAGHCASGNGDVSITFGTLSYTTECQGFFGIYETFENVSAETTTNPIRHCVTQTPFAEVCSKIASNELAPPGLSFDSDPLEVITSSNGAPGRTYNVRGSCAPVGATIDISFDSGTVVLSGLCENLNFFNIAGDVSPLSDGTNIPVTATINDGTNIGTTNSSVSKFLTPDPVPLITNVNLSENDIDSDSWLEAGDHIEFVVSFSETVKVDSIVTLDFNLNSGVKSAQYVSGSPGTSITFRMNVNSGDDLCSGPLATSGISVPGDGIKDLTDQDADTSTFPSTFTISPIDAVAPSFGGLFNLASSNANPSQSPKFNGPGFNITENCTGVILEGALEETVSTNVAQPSLALPASAITNQEYRFFDGIDGFSFSLIEETLHKAVFTAIDQAGNTISANSSQWTVSPAGVLPNLIVHLTGQVFDSLIDQNGLSANDVGFTGDVEFFTDVSESAVVHDFDDRTTTGRPFFNTLTKELEFDGVDDCMKTANHPELNTATVVERSYGLLFKSGADITTRQTVFEEGAQVRGMNVYIDNGRLYCGFWNQTNDGDGFQAFLGHSVLIQPDTVYSVTPVFDYTNYTGPTGPDGTFQCYVDGLAIGADLPSTSRLFAHSGDVSLGCNGSRTIQHDGDSGNVRQYFQGNILELMVFNTPPDDVEADSIYNYLRLTWDL